MKRTLLNTAPASAIPFDFSHTTKEASIHRAAKFVLPLASIALTLGLLPSSPISAQARSLSQPTQQRTEANSSAQDGKDVRSLEPDKPIERELAGGEAHSYRIMLNRGEYLHVAVDQRGIDVVVALRGPDGAQLMEMDGLSGMLGMEEVSWEAASAGGYVLEVRAKAKAANAGRYEVRVEKAAAATARERARITAEQLYMEGIRAQGEGRGEALEKAIKKYGEAVEKWRGAGERKWEAQTLLNLGVIYANLSQHEKARDYYEQALAISREIKDREGEGITLGNLGNVYENLSQYEKARDYYEQALAISREIKDRRGVAETLGNLGNVYANLSQHEKARDYYEQALAIRREIKDRRGVAETLGNLGVIYANLSQEYEKARDYYEQALAIRRETKDRRGEGQTLKNLGNVYESLSQHERAREHFEQALAISREIKDSGGEASTLLSVASLERDRGNLSEARKQIESALAIVENLRATYTNQELRAAYFASVQDYYEFYIDLLMRLHKQDPAAGHEAAALQASERARARALLDLLAEAGADIRQGVDPQLVERERSLQRQLNIKAQQQTKLLSGQQTTEQAAAIAREIESLTNEYQQLQAQIRQSSPRYAALTQPVPLSLKEIQAQLLDADTLLLEYSLGQERSYLWAVTPASITSYELPKQAEIEEVARQVYAQMAKAGQVARTDASGQRGIGDALSQSPHVAAATRLSQMLLSPVSAQLGKKRLLIVSDGALQFIPFAALPIPTVGKTIAYQPLIAKHEIVSLPSASTLAVLRRETGRRAPAPKAVAVLADPVFEKTDERLKMSAAQPEGGNGARAVGADTDRGLGLEVTKAAEESGVASVGLRIPRLPGTKREAEQILKLVPATERKAAFDFAASHATATSPELSQYRYVHFATHGFLNSQHPELSGIMLSMFDERGQPQDGFLRAHEVFNLKLPAELVVLSACQTGLGKEVRGEGLVGLTRGFMYAGAPRVVVSLWSVSDAATAELMTRFYRKMLQDKMRPAAALRSAQVSLMKEKKWNAPFYWAAFTLQGEWR